MVNNAMQETPKALLTHVLVSSGGSRIWPGGVHFVTMGSGGKQIAESVDDWSISYFLACDSRKFVKKLV